MSYGFESKSARADYSVEVHPVRVREREPNFIMMAVMAFAIFVIITAYFGK
jgi:hypothetical protein